MRKRSADRASGAAPQTEADRIAAGLRQSLQGTAAGLQSFCAAMEAGGLTGAVDEYRKMQWVLLAQREWSRREKRKELDAEWAAIAAHAAALHRLFTAMADVFDPLRWVDGSVPQVRQPGPAAERVREVVSAALEQFELPNSRKDAALFAELEQLGLLQREQKGRIKRWRLSEGLRSRLATQAAAQAGSQR